MKITKQKILGIIIAVLVLIFAIIVYYTKIPMKIAIIVFAIGFWGIFVCELLSYKQLKKVKGQTYEKLTDLLRMLSFAIIALILTVVEIIILI